DRDYRIEVSAFGTRETEGRSTTEGLLYSGSGIASGVSADEPTVVPIVLENRVPFLDGEAVSNAVVLTWTEIASALRYHVREQIEGGEFRDLFVSGTDTLLALPPGRGIGGETRSYRVRAQLPAELSAFSETWSLELSGPTPPSAVSDLAAGTITPTSIQLRWTAPGDD